MTDQQVKHMVDRFLGWRLPKPWLPDNGISYQRPNYAHAPADHDWPTGTNLFDADQATAMVRYIIEDAPFCDSFAWLIEAPGQHYLAVRAVAGNKFFWVQDHGAALRFFSEEQADLAMLAIRQLDPELFGFAKTLGEAKPVEHAWVNR